MLHKTNGIVLHHINYGDTSIIAYIYTELFGRQAFIVNNVRSSRSKIRLNLFQPLSIVELSIYFKENREIQRIKDIRFLVPQNEIPFHIIKSSIALFIAEILYRTLREEEQNKSLFDFLFHAIQLLDNTHEGINNFHLVFLIQLSKFLGIFPDKTFIYSYGANESERRILHELVNSSLQTLTMFNINNVVRNNLLIKLLEHYRLHMEGMGQINSFIVLKDLFNT